MLQTSSFSYNNSTNKNSILYSIYFYCATYYELIIHMDDHSTGKMKLIFESNINKSLNSTDFELLKN